MNALFSGAQGQTCHLAKGEATFQPPPAAASPWGHVSPQQEGWMDPERWCGWQMAGAGMMNQERSPTPPQGWKVRLWSTLPDACQVQCFLTDTSQLAVCCQRLVCSTWFAFLIWKPNIFHGFDLVPLGSWDKPFTLSHWASSNGPHLLHTQH